MLDSPIHLIEATVQLEQATGGGERTVGTGFLLSAPTPDGSPGTLLVTAHHVLAGMSGPEAKVGYRAVQADGSWRYTPAELKIRDRAGQPLWTRHPTQDVAAIRIKAPPEFARAAIPVGYLAADDAFAERNLGPGDELMVLGFPRGVAANNAGFPILRSGRVASYPLSPKSSPTFLLDFSVFPGNSGGPVFHTTGLRRTGSAPGKPFIAGLLTQQVKLNDERLEIGIVTHAKHIAETLDLVEGVRRPREIEAKVAIAAPPMPGAQPASEGPDRRPLWRRSVGAVRQGAAGAVDAVARAFRRSADRLIAWLDPPTRTA